MRTTPIPVTVGPFDAREDKVMTVTRMEAPKPYTRIKKRRQSRGWRPGGAPSQWLSALLKHALGG